MNLSVITAQIISKPKILNVQQKTIIYMNVIIPNEKKNLAFYNIYVYSLIHKYDKFCELYQVKDIVILKGHIYIKQNPNNILKSYNYITMKIDDIQPYIRYIK
uniref:Putative single-stranded DNA binding protein n=1 Tax=Ceramothamnion japonicum TaxID=218448 RepID=A0A1C9CD88_CERJP|nr:putative single-stranded DNA binding protein [Ceramium japonicum]AOM66327.1 putative single-stranded DNA binding protein [Ceramium japonicum]